MGDLRDYAVPVSVLAERFANHADELRARLADLPWWQWRKRAILAGAISAYVFEEETIVRVGGQMSLEDFFAASTDIKEG